MPLLTSPDGALPGLEPVAGCNATAGLPPGSARPLCHRRSDSAGHSRICDGETDRRSVALANGPRLNLSVMKPGRDRGGPRSGVPSAGLLVSSDTRPAPLRNGRPEEQ